MSKLKIKRLLAIIITTLLTTSFVACSSGAPTTTTSSGTATTSSTSSAQGDTGSSGTPASALTLTDNLNKEGLPILKEKKTYKVVSPQISTKVAAKDKECYIKTAEETNVLFDITEIPSANWKEKVNIMFASSDLPDMFVGDIDVANQYEQLLVLDDYITELAPNVVQLMEDRPEYKKILTAPDGKIHFLPGGDEAYMNQIDQQLWINKNWLDAVGATVPTTTEEFYNVLKLFKDNDPNKNGKADEIPFTFNGIWDWATGMGNMMGSFGTLEGGGHVYVKDNTVHFAPEETGFFESLKYFNTLFKEKLIDPEVFTQSAEQYNSRGKGKDIFGAVVGYRANYVLGPEQKENFVGVAPLKGPNGDQMIRANYINQLTGVQITNACKEPEVLVRWYDYINSSTELSLRWGRGLEGTNWKKYEVDGAQKYAINLPVDKDAKPPVEREDVSWGGQSPALWMLHRDEAMSIINPDDTAPDLKRDLITASMPFAYYGMPAGLDNTENTQKKALLITDIDTYLEKFVADSIMNGIDDAKWAAHLNTLKSLKVDEYKTLQQEFLSK